jgi:hypothetical protein
MVHLTYTCGCFFLTPIVAGIHLVDGALESPSGWSAGVVWVGSGVARAVSVSGSICGGGGGRWVWDGVLGGAPVSSGLGWGRRRCIGVWVRAPMSGSIGGGSGESRDLILREQLKFFFWHLTKFSLT